MSPPKTAAETRDVRMTTSEIRSAFLDYFAAQDHEIVESAPIVPKGDPTLLFVNAGMVPFKDVFTGRAKATSPRAASSQRCLRVSGKHNDLEEVGRTPRHHTFFEMLGNFSFGDYFKAEAIAYAHEFLVDVLKLDESRLAYTVFGGEGEFPADEEAERLWRDVTGAPAERIQRFGMKDNFWAMGDTGPCGPCSEIHYDLGPELAGTVNDGDRWVEIWNLVFMQYQRDGSGTLSALPHPAIDTGMGLERAAAVVQGRTSNYDGDLFRSLLGEIAGSVGREYGGTGAENDVSLRVLADHARTTAFLLAEDVAPDKTGRGYVLRKIMRRAISHGVLLGVDRPFLADAAEAVIGRMGEAYPVLRERAAAIRRGADAEETLFRRTVEAGMRRIDDLMERLTDDSIWENRDGTRVLKGDVAFRLYDTHGCPLELTASVGVRRGFEVDEAGFVAAMEEQKQRSRAAWRGGEGGAQALEAAVAASAKGRPVSFTGYDSLEGESRVRGVALFGSGEPHDVDRAGEGAVVAVVTDSTPFYGESGGQVGDAGTLAAPGGRVRVEDTQKLLGGELVVHLGTVDEGEIACGDTVRQAVDAVRRERIAAHHTATHLVHHALREILGRHVSQKGSYVGVDHLRFDFSHSAPVAADELAAAEDRVNELARQNWEVAAAVMTKAEADRLGALAFFGEKYGNEVRVVTMGPSRELCGGTHLVATGDLGYFTFLSEGSVASGVRRVEAVGGSEAVERARATREELSRLGERLKVSPDEVGRKLDDLLDEAKRLRRRLEELERVAAGEAARDLAGSAETVAGHRVITGRVPVESRDALRDLADSLRQSGASTVVVLGTEMEGKVALAAAVSDDVVKAGVLKAGDLVGRVARVAGGGGGGKPHLATAGAKDVARLGDALAAVPGLVAELVG